MNVLGGLVAAERMLRRIKEGERRREGKIVELGDGFDLSSLEQEDVVRFGYEGCGGFKVVESADESMISIYGPLINRLNRAIEIRSCATIESRIDKTCLIMPRENHEILRRGDEGYDEKARTLAGLGFREFSDYIIEKEDAK
ncbi:hypothetical protein CMI48_02005 [Candidatus Pacearchaeota archaeon]|nr:hypothetical protein [Candidatus Pacearchaeota archaeon]|tara:strand:+ start:330 stop:755 length:426 start_codon:yes stop_codon:yes gene_type:complete